MKRIFSICFVCVLLLSCQTAPTIIDRGVFNQNNSPESDLVILTTHKYVSIEQIDNKATGFENLTHNQHSQTLKINPGVHTFAIYFNNGVVFTVFPKTVVVNLEAGKSYFIEGNVINKELKVSFTDTITKTNAVLDMNQLRGNSQTVISTYIKYILNPTMEESNKKVQIENENTLIIFNPDMTYIMIDKITNKTTYGYSGFNMNFSMNDAKVYLLETDITKMTKDEFLNKSDYVQNAQTIMIPIKCSETSVTYKYQKPENVKDQEISFSIKQLPN